MKKMALLITIVCIGCMIPTMSCTRIIQNQLDISHSIHVNRIPISIEKYLGEINVSVTVGSYSIIKTMNGEKIVAEGYGRVPNPGEPFLPSKIVSIAIPSNAVLTDLRWDLGKKIELNGTYNIIQVPASTQIKESTQIFSNIETMCKSTCSYESDIVYLVGTSGYRAYNLVDVRVSPFVYSPTSGIVEYYPTISLTITYQLDIDSYKPVLIQDPSQREITKDVILNIDQAQEWYTALQKCSRMETYDFVIIILDSLVDAVESLVQWETEKGRSVKVVTLSWITDNYVGYDDAEKIRNFLREKYPDDQWGIQYVCIIGHLDDIPMRKTSQRIGINYEPVETDFYYAELSLPDNESWDSDNDHLYGENADSIDYFGEVFVGRIPWSEPDIVRHICEKSVAFEQNTDPSFKNNILLLANFIDENTDGATFMEYCVNEELHPWMKTWLKTRLYERNSIYHYDYVLNRINVVNVWSKGTYGVVSWNSHGNPYGSGNFISVDDCQYLNDEFPSIISAASCSNSDTDYLNIGQVMMGQGAVGFLGANKVAFYQSQWDDPSDGSDQSFKYFFLSAITSGKFTQGQAHQYAISEMYQRGLWDMLKYETFCHGSLFGNPDISLILSCDNNAPMKPGTPDGATLGQIHKEQTYSTVSIDPEGDEIYYCFSWGDGVIEWFGPYKSDLEVEVSHTWTEGGDFEIKVKAKDVYGAESEWSDPLQVAMPKSRTLTYIYPILKDMFSFFISFTC